MEEVIFVKGNFINVGSEVPWLERGFLYGYGLFETVLVRRGRPVLLTPHLERLQKSSAKLDLPLPMALKEIERAVRETVDRNEVQNGSLRINLSAGRSPGEEGTLFIFTRRVLPYLKEQYRNGFKVGYVGFRRNEHSPLVGFKTMNYLENLLARNQARREGFDEGIFINTSGYVTEGTMSNVFIYKNGVLTTPSPEQGLLPGIIRQVVLDACASSGITVEERPVLPEELPLSEEVFLTNSLMGAMPVVSVEGVPVGGVGRPGSICSWVYRYLENLE